MDKLDQYFLKYGLKNSDSIKNYILWNENNCKIYSGFSTRAIHAGNNADPVHGGVVPSLDLSTTFA